MTEDDLYKGFFQTQDVIERVLISRYLCGSRYPSETLILQKRKPQIMFDLAKEIGLPLHLVELLSLSRSQEFYVPLLASLMDMEEAEQKTIQSDTISKHQMIGLYPSYTYDRHTRTGKQAFRLFLNRYPDVRTYVEKTCPKKNMINLISWAVFILEGQSSKDRLIYLSSNQIQTLAEQAWLYSGGMEITYHQGFTELIRQKFDYIEQARKDVV